MFSQLAEHKKRAESRQLILPHLAIPQILARFVRKSNRRRCVVLFSLPFSLFLVLFFRFVLVPVSFSFSSLPLDPTVFARLTGAAFDNKRYASHTGSRNIKYSRAFTTAAAVGKGTREEERIGGPSVPAVIRRKEDQDEKARRQRERKERTTRGGKGCCSPASPPSLVDEFIEEKLGGL